jgi:hypothetical protein
LGASKREVGFLDSQHKTLLVHALNELVDLGFKVTLNQCMQMEAWFEAAMSDRPNLSRWTGGSGGSNGD